MMKASGTLGYRDNSPYAFYEGPGVELGAQYLIGAVSESCYAPVTDEGHELVLRSSADCGTERFCRVNV